MPELDDESRIIKKLLVIKEICSWRQAFRPSNPEGSHEHVSLITDRFFNDFAFIIQCQHEGTLGFPCVTSPRSMLPPRDVNYA